MIGQINDHLHIHIGFQHHLRPGDGMGKFQPFGTEHLVRQPQLRRNPLGFFTAVLGISQNGEAHVGAVDPQLVGPAGDGAQRQFS